MPEYVSDTHALYWYLRGMPQLGPNALAAFLSAENGQAQIIIPVIVLAELYYLNAKVGNPLLFRDTISKLQSASQFVFVDLGLHDILSFDALTLIPEMHDRIIAGVALFRNCPCLTRDPLIIRSGVVATIW